MAFSYFFLSGGQLDKRILACMAANKKEMKIISIACYSLIMCLWPNMVVLTIGFFIFFLFSRRSEGRGEVPMLG